MKKNAYVTFIIRNDSYLPGALVFAYALKKQNTKYDLICIVSDNITDKAKENLLVLYDEVIVLKEGQVIRPHAHHRIPRTVNFTTEVLFCVSGRIVYTFYDEKENWGEISSCELTSGDLLCLFGAGHGGKSLEPTRLIEVKQGPYLAARDNFFYPEGES